MKSLDEARLVKERIEGDILSRPGVTGIDVAYDAEARGQTPVIRIYVADRVARERADLPTEVEGIPVRIVERVFRPH